MVLYLYRQIGQSISKVHSTCMLDQTQVVLLCILRHTETINQYSWCWISLIVNQRWDKGARDSESDLSLGSGHRACFLSNVGNTGPRLRAMHFYVYICWCLIKINNKNWRNLATTVRVLNQMFAWQLVFVINQRSRNTKLIGQLICTPFINKRAFMKSLILVHIIVISSIAQV